MPGPMVGGGAAPDKSHRPRARTALHTHTAPAPLPPLPTIDKPQPFPGPTPPLRRVSVASFATVWHADGMRWRGGGPPPPPPGPSLCPATVPLTASANFNGVCNRQ